MNNILDITSKLLSLLKIDKTKSYLKEHLLSHPDYPSILTISDTLERYNVDSVAIRNKDDKLHEIPLPCIVQVENQSSKLFYLLNKIKDETFECYNEQIKEIKLSRKQFQQIWTGVCLLVERKESSMEPNLQQRRFRRNAIAVLSLLCFILLFTFLGTIAYHSLVFGPPFTTFLIVKCF